MLATPDEVATLRAAVDLYHSEGCITDSEADHLDNILDRLLEH